MLQTKFVEKIKPTIYDQYLFFPTIVPLMRKCGKVR